MVNDLGMDSPSSGRRRRPLPGHTGGGGGRSLGDRIFNSGISNAIEAVGRPVVGAVEAGIVTPLREIGQARDAVLSKLGGVGVALDALIPDPRSGPLTVVPGGQMLIKAGQMSGGSYVSPKEREAIRKREGVTGFSISELFGLSGKEGSTARAFIEEDPQLRQADPVSKILIEIGIGTARDMGLGRLPKVLKTVPVGADVVEKMVGGSKQLRIKTHSRSISNNLLKQAADGTLAQAARQELGVKAARVAVGGIGALTPDELAQLGYERLLSVGGIGIPGTQKAASKLGSLLSDTRTKVVEKFTGSPLDILGEAGSIRRRQALETIRRAEKGFLPQAAITPAKLRQEFSLPMTPIEAGFQIRRIGRDAQATAYAEFQRVKRDFLLNIGGTVNKKGEVSAGDVIKQLRRSDPTRGIKDVRAGAQAWLDHQLLIQQHPHLAKIPRTPTLSPLAEATMKALDAVAANLPATTLVATRVDGGGIRTTPLIDSFRAAVADRLIRRADEYLASVAQHPGAAGRASRFAAGKQEPIEVILGGFLKDSIYVHEGLRVASISGLGVGTKFMGKARSILSNINMEAAPQRSRAYIHGLLGRPATTLGAAVDTPRPGPSLRSAHAEGLKDRWDLRDIVQGMDRGFLSRSAMTDIVRTPDPVDVERNLDTLIDRILNGGKPITDDETASLILKGQEIVSLTPEAKRSDYVKGLLHSAEQSIDPARVSSAFKNGMRDRAMLRKALRDLDSTVSPMPVADAFGNANATMKIGKAMPTHLTIDGLLKGADINSEFIKAGLVAFADNALYMTEQGLIGEDIVRQVARMTAPQRLPAFTKYIQGLTILFREQALISPGFSNRNWFGGMLNNYILGAGLHWARQAAIASKDPNKVSPEVRKAWYAYMHKSAALASRQALEGGGFYSGFRAAANRVGTTLDQTGYSLRGLMTGTRKITQPVEENLRGALFLKLVVEDGMSYDEALEWVERVHFDYLDVSRADQVMKTFSPFWVWNSRNLPLQTEFLLRGGGTGRALLSAQMHATAAAEQQGDATYPGFLTGLWMPMAPDTVLNLGSAPVSSLLELGQSMHRDGAVRSGLAEVLGQVQPALRVPVEYALNKSGFTRQGKSASQAAYDNLPWLRLVDRLAPVTPGGRKTVIDRPGAGAIGFAYDLLAEAAIAPDIRRYRR